jgi:thiopurine S-methyltransferase
MFKEFWDKRWSENQIGFHEGRPNEFLQRFAERLGTQPSLRVLVPLCGKSVDLRWLAEQGFRVLGIEFVAQAAEAFFQEQGLSDRVARGEEGGLPSLAAGAIEIAVGDFFRWDPQRSAPIDVAYDRAALVAVRPEDRQRYVDHLLGALPVSGRLLLVTFAYDAGVMSGPPFSVDAGEVERLFGARCEVQCLADEDILDREPRFRQRGLERLREQAWLIERLK